MREPNEPSTCFDHGSLQFIESAFTVRNKEIYDHHCESLGGPLHEHMATTYGMWRNSELNRLKYFHVTTGMVPDIMHDILEGSLELCIRHLLVEYIREQKAFSLSTLNERIKTFMYGVDIKSKPSELSTIHPDVALKQSGNIYTVLRGYIIIIIVWLHFLSRMQHLRCGAWGGFFRC